MTVDEDLYDNPPPLLQALWDGDFDTAARLIEEGARLDDLIETDGNTLLHDAAQDGRLDMVDFFLRHDSPRSRESYDEIAETPLVRAADSGQTEVVARLLAAGVDPNNRDEQKIGNTAIREAVRGGHVDIVRMLLDARADPTIPGWMGISAVDQAWYGVEGGGAAERAIRKLLRRFPSKVRDGD
ncbi:MAG: ankyrin repeat domain-containing protein [Acidobacteriota bacterium]